MEDGEAAHKEPYSVLDKVQVQDLLKGGGGLM